MIGIDEVGRGAWAGPLLVCAARLRIDIEGLNDSKLLSAKRREILNVEILQKADIGYGWVLSSEIDEFGLARALKLAARRAIIDISPMANEQIIIDGSINLLPDLPQVETIIKADMTITAVMAASIVAKVARDAYMHDLAEQYPDYGFENHVGYGTAMHADAIKKYGLCLQHRHSFRLPTT